MRNFIEKLRRMRILRLNLFRFRIFNFFGKCDKWGKEIHL